MKILLIFTFCLISDGGSSKEVTGYSGGGILIKCKYDTEYRYNKKYFCKGSMSGCSDQIKTGDRSQWVNSGRFSLFDDTKSSEFLVMIRELTVQDNGTYHCGVDRTLVRDIYTPVELKVQQGFFGVFIRELIIVDTATNVCSSVVSDEMLIYTVVKLNVRENLSYEKSISKSVHAGEDFTVSCKYPQSLKSYQRFLCKRLPMAACSYNIYFKESILNMTMKNVNEQDSGEYWCGADVAWTSDHGYKVYFIQIDLTVTGLSPVSIVITVLVNILIGLLIGNTCLFVVLRIKRKRQDGSTDKRELNGTHCEGFTAKIRGLPSAPVEHGHAVILANVNVHVLALPGVT
ncbi:uncharacterized protein LOC125141156 isoform X2 [Tachysurus ichikawai]